MGPCKPKFRWMRFDRSDINYALAARLNSGKTISFLTRSPEEEFYWMQGEKVKSIFGFLSVLRVQHLDDALHEHPLKHLFEGDLYWENEMRGKSGDYITLALAEE